MTLPATGVAGGGGRPILLGSEVRRLLTPRGYETIVQGLMVHGRLGDRNLVSTASGFHWV